ncbi:MAG: FprA family A-type flavoprotein [Theionarchaea archaeon]|nr:FprA family A-type flavoprotein [Theionarchaea archaeon]
MGVRPLTEDIFQVGSIDWDRTLFDELIPLPDGTSYNAYVVTDERCALMDTVDPTKTHELLANLTELDAEIEYIIAHHAEQDHSGSIPAVLDIYPEATVVTNPKCKTLLMEMLHIPEDTFMTVGDGDTLSLGEKTLEFIYAPWVHWPETMFTYVKEEQVLFTCDFLGSHLATSHLFVEDMEEVYNPAKRYYAEIMMPFRTSIRSHLEKLDSMEITIIAPSHGPVYDTPSPITDAYKEWVSDAVKNEVVLPFVSMHGSTRDMVDYFIDALMRRDITVKPFNLTTADIGELAMSLVDAATVVIASPTVLTGPHPRAVYAAYLVNALRPKCRFASVIGSFGWGGKMVEMLTQSMQNLHAEFLEPVLVKGHPTEKEFKMLDILADQIYKKHKDITI